MTMGNWQNKMRYGYNEKREKHMTGGIELQNQEKVRIAQRKRKLHILGNIGSGHH